MRLRECVICGEEFTPTSKRRKYCSKDCRDEAYGTYMRRYMRRWMRDKRAKRKSYVYKQVGEAYHELSKMPGVAPQFELRGRIDPTHDAIDFVPAFTVRKGGKMLKVPAVINIGSPDPTRDPFTKRLLIDELRKK